MNKTTSNIFLFLDDIRYPEEAFLYTSFFPFKLEEWVIVRDYDEFVSHIKQHGIPKFISFDHDLADVHYKPVGSWEEYYKNTLKENNKEKTGYDCALWLINYCMDNNTNCPDFYCHSMNPVGREKIINVLNDFIKYHNKKC